MGGRGGAFGGQQGQGGRPGGPIRPQVHFENGQPGFQGTMVTPCFKENGNGLLFRVINEADKTWAFYNDTIIYSMVVRYVFGKESQIEILGNTHMEMDPSTGEYKCELQIEPQQTEMFIRGTPNGFRVNFEAIPVVMP